MGLSCCPPDSWCKRFDVDNAWLKSERFLNGPSVSRLIERDPPILPVVKSIRILHSIGVILFCKNVRCTTNIFISIVFDHPFTEDMISQEKIMDPCEFSFNASLFQVLGQMIFFVV